MFGRGFESLRLHKTKAQLQSWAFVFGGGDERPIRGFEQFLCGLRAGIAGRKLSLRLHKTKAQLQSWAFTFDKKGVIPELTH